MAIPDFQTVMLPLLRLTADGVEHKLSDAMHALEDQFGLSEEERHTLLPSRTQTVIHNRVAWASTYMLKAGLLESTRRGHFKITQCGRSPPIKAIQDFCRRSEAIPGILGISGSRSNGNAVRHIV